jgi:ribose/xylose/arabinose/galactoside ABC-type transport system permease subunit
VLVQARVGLNLFSHFVFRTETDMSATPSRPIPWGALGPWLALLATCIFFATQSDRFLSGENLSLVLQQVMVVGVLAIGQTLIILTAGIDLSCGMVMALGGVVMTKFAVASTPTWPLSAAWQSPPVLV